MLASRAVCAGLSSRRPCQRTACMAAMPLRRARHASGRRSHHVQAAEPVDQTPAMITVISGDELRARGVTDLRTALSLVAGVDIAPGGDAGPAGSVPGLWGLREFDAFLLVVDGVPAGGAFNPALPTLDLTDVERIEVLRGAAPVMYGATSFVGVIQVIHYPAGATPSRATLGVGTRSAGMASISGDLPTTEHSSKSISANVSTQAIQPAPVRRRSRPRAVPHRRRHRSGQTAFRFRCHGAAPGSVQPASGRERHAVAAFPAGCERQPDRRAPGPESPAVQRRVATATSALGEWVTTFSVDHSDGRNTRGFLRQDFAVDGVTHNADGFRQTVRVTDAYFDTSSRPCSRRTA